MRKELAFILVGDHLGQVKKVLFPSGEVSLLDGCNLPSSSNPVVSIEPITYSRGKQLIANQDGRLHIYDCLRNVVKECTFNGESNLIKALPYMEHKVAFVYDKQISYDATVERIKQKKSEIKCARISDGKLAYAGVNIPLRVLDMTKGEGSYCFEGAPPDKDWLGVKPEIYVSDLTWVGETRVATCSRSDSVIRVFDTRGKQKPVITTDFKETAFNEHAESARFHSIASTGDSGHAIVVGSNVGQLYAIDLRFNVKSVPDKKRLKPRTYKILGSFKGSRGATIKDVKLAPAQVPAYAGRDEMDTVEGHRVISCSLDRYLRIYNMSRNNRSLFKHVYMTTKPQCCSPVLYADF